MAVREAQPPRKPRRDAELNRERILTAARDAFAERGLDVGVDEIARRSGVGMGTLYRHFPTKDALIEAIFDSRLDAVAAAAREALELPDPWEGFVAFVTRTVEMQAADRGLGQLLAGRRRDERALARKRATMTPLVERVLERAQAAGALRADFTDTDLGALFWSTGRVVELTGPVAPSYWRRFLALLLDGLRAGSAGPLPEPPLTRRQHTRAMAALAERRRPRPRAG